MEKIFYVRDNKLDEVNRELAKGGTVKLIQAVQVEYNSHYADAIIAYVVISYPD